MEDRSTRLRTVQPETRLGAALVLGALAAATTYALVIFTAVVYVMMVEAGTGWPDLYWAVALPGATAALTMKLYAAAYRGQLDDQDS